MQRHCAVTKKFPVWKVLSDWKCSVFLVSIIFGYPSIGIRYFSFSFCSFIIDITFTGDFKEKVRDLKQQTKVVKYGVTQKGKGERWT